MEKRVIKKEENVEKKADSIEKKEELLIKKEKSIEEKKAKIDELFEEQVQELERLSGLTSEDAKQILLEDTRKEIVHESAVMIREMETEAKENAEKNSREIIARAIQKYAADHVAETTVTVVTLPNDEMKGRIIGREEIGRASCRERV